ncbi:MAG: hypothetical protein ACD_39C01401G0001 [uncultured bacterium]|nr:MAG: hypothetical protein ACD_39C01401G0001 [uncultured bacterium]
MIVPNPTPDMEMIVGGAKIVRPMAAPVLGGIFSLPMKSSTCFSPCCPTGSANAAGLH